MKNRASSVLEIKSLDDQARVIEGIASTPSPDRMGDVVDPMGANFKLPLPLLWQHDAGSPVGHVIAATPGEKGIAIRAQLQRTDEPGTVKDRLDAAWLDIKLGLVRALSIGFSPVKFSILKDGGYEYLEWDWLELSAVTIPANADCTIQTIKSIDRANRHAIGLPDPETIARPGPAATGTTARIVRLNDPARDRAPHVITHIKRT